LRAIPANPLGGFAGATPPPAKPPSFALSPGEISNFKWQISNGKFQMANFKPPALFHSGRRDIRTFSFLHSKQGLPDKLPT
jgi:hypothetical protein